MGQTSLKGPTSAGWGRHTDDHLPFSIQAAPTFPCEVVVLLICLWFHLNIWYEMGALCALADSGLQCGDLSGSRAPLT